MIISLGIRWYSRKTCLAALNGVSRTSEPGTRGRVDCQLKNIETEPNQYVWKLGDQVLQTGSDYTVQVNAMFFGSQTTILYVESSPAVDTSYTCIADWGGDTTASTTALLDVISKLIILLPRFE